MSIQPIRTRTDHKRALDRIEALMDAKRSAAETAELDALATLVTAYEDKHFPIEAPSPIEAIRFRMEQMGLRQVDLAPTLGGRNRVSEVLSGKRGLSVSQIKALHRDLKIPFDLLLGEAG